MEIIQTSTHRDTDISTASIKPPLTYHLLAASTALSPHTTLTVESTTPHLKEDFPWLGHVHISAPSRPGQSHASHSFSRWTQEQRPHAHIPSCPNCSLPSWTLREEAKELTHQPHVTGEKTKTDLASNLGFALARGIILNGVLVTSGPVSFMYKEETIVLAWKHCGKGWI